MYKAYNNSRCVTPEINYYLGLYNFVNEFGHEPKGGEYARGWLDVKTKSGHTRQKINGHDVARLTILLERPSCQRVDAMERHLDLVDEFARAFPDAHFTAELHTMTESSGSEKYVGWYKTKLMIRVNELHLFR